MSWDERGQTESGRRARRTSDLKQVHRKEERLPAAREVLIRSVGHREF